MQRIRWILGQAVLWCSVMVPVGVVTSPLERLPAVIALCLVVAAIQDYVRHS